MIFGCPGEKRWQLKPGTALLQGQGRAGRPQRTIRTEGRRKKKAQPKTEGTLHLQKTALSFEAGPEPGSQGRQGGQMW